MVSYDKGKLTDYIVKNNKNKQKVNLRVISLQELIILSKISNYQKMTCPACKTVLIKQKCRIKIFKNGGYIVQRIRPCKICKTDYITSDGMISIYSDVKKQFKDTDRFFDEERKRMYLLAQNQNNSAKKILGHLCQKKGDMSRMSKEDIVSYCIFLGDLYCNGDGVHIDYSKAFKWYKIAAEQGVSIAQLKVGDMYYNGLGLKQDYSKAVKWYKLAASKNIEAQIRLGDCYYCGIGVEMNYAEANRWYNRSKDIQTDDETLYIHKGRIICRYNKHNIEPVTAIMTGQNNSEIHFNVFYCNNCGKFFIDYESYKLYRKKFGIILGDIKMLQGDNYYSVYVSRNEYSPLKLCGYSVGNSSNLAIDQRREIIVYCIETDIMSKYEIINLLRMLINVNGSKSGNEYARYEWESDLMFTLDYIESQKSHTIKDVKIYSRNHFRKK